MKFINVGHDRYVLKESILEVRFDSYFSEESQRLYYWCIFIFKDSKDDIAPIKKESRYLNINLDKRNTDRITLSSDLETAKKEFKDIIDQLNS